MVDSCVALNTMYHLPFGMYLCKEYPWLLSVVYGSKGHHSIHLSGIVKDDKTTIFTELPVAFVFKTPYTTTVGNPIKVTFPASKDVSVNAAVVKYVTVNANFGLHYIRSIGSVLESRLKLDMFSSQWSIAYSIAAILPKQLTPSRITKQR